MALSSTTRQDISDQRNRFRFHSSEMMANQDVGKDHIADYISHYWPISEEPYAFGNLKTTRQRTEPDHRSSSHWNSEPKTGGDLVMPILTRYRQSMSEMRSLAPEMEWEGSVERIEDDAFVASLVNVTTGEVLPTEDAWFPISELNDIQRENLEVGAIFRWVIGLQRLPNGNKQRVSELFFRRLPAHSSKEIEAALENARKHMDAHGRDDSPSR